MADASETKARKILYSPGFGAGWVSWHHGDARQLRFMLEYPPFIERLESGGYVDSALIEQWRADWKERFPGVDTPYEGGLGQLVVMSVPVGARVRIDEYDGSESVTVEGDYEGWL